MAGMKRDTSSPSLSDPTAPVLVIVESPTKATTIGKYLGDGYVVRATVGHIADIPTSGKAVDTANGFAVEYELTERGAEIVRGLRADLDRCSRVVLATDADREGEMIAWTVLHFLAPTLPVSRIEFHSVTKDALLQALANQRDIDMDMVAAARTRRILDRLFGYGVTDVARSRINQLATAGRVQSPAVCMVVERELERMAFVPARHWDVQLSSGTRPSFTARLRTVDGQRIAGGDDFGADGALKNDRLVLGPVRANEIALGLCGEWTLTVTGIQTKEATRNPRPPLTASSLYSQGTSAVGMSVAEIKAVSSSLYQKGHITYVRTDLAVHEPASRAAIKAAIAAEFGKEMVNPADRYTTVKGAKVQGAHEAIRPTDLQVRNPKGITPREQKLYIWIRQRTLATQMVPAKGTATTVTLRTEDPTDPGRWCEFVATGTVWHERGFLSAFGDDGDGESPLPPLAEGQTVKVRSAEAVEHSTKPPARFTEGSLVDELKERGIGRPSTYDTIVRKLRDRFVVSRGKRSDLVPNATAFAVHRMLTGSFASLVDYDYTRRLEDILEGVATDGEDPQSVLHRFWFGDGDEPGLAALVQKFKDEVDPRDLYSLVLGTDPGTGETVTVRPGLAYGTRTAPFVEMGSERMTIKESTDLSSLNVEQVAGVLGGERTRLLGVHEGRNVYVRRNLDGAYLQFGEAGGRKKKGEKATPRPEFAPVPDDADATELTLDDAVASLTAHRAELEEKARKRAAAPKGARGRGPGRGRRT